MRTWKKYGKKDGKQRLHHKRKRQEYITLAVFLIIPLLFLLYSDRARIRAGRSGRPWFEELAISERQRSFLHDAFFRKESFDSFEEFGSRFAAAFSSRF